MLTKEQIRKINKSALAEQHDTSQSYVSEILYGKKATNTDKARAIYEHALRIVEVLEGKPLTDKKAENV